MSQPKKQTLTIKPRGVKAKSHYVVRNGPWVELWLDTGRKDGFEVISLSPMNAKRMAEKIQRALSFQPASVGEASITQTPLAVDCPETLPGRVSNPPAGSKTPAKRLSVSEERRWKLILADVSAAPGLPHLTQPSMREVARLRELNKASRHGGRSESCGEDSKG